MSGTSYVFDVKRFDALRAMHGISTRSEFISRSGIPRRTFQRLIAGTSDPSMSVATYFVDAFPGTTIADFFVRRPTQARAA